jgi:hypothetical protein
MKDINILYFVLAYLYYKRNYSSYLGNFTDVDNLLSKTIEHLLNELVILVDEENSIDTIINEDIPLRNKEDVDTYKKDNKDKIINIIKSDSLKELVKLELENIDVTSRDDIDDILIYFEKTCLFDKSCDSVLNKIMSSMASKKNMLTCKKIEKKCVDDKFFTNTMCNLEIKYDMHMVESYTLFIDKPINVDKLRKDTPHCSVYDGHFSTIYYDSNDDFIYVTETWSPIINYLDKKCVFLKFKPKQYGNECGYIDLLITYYWYIYKIHPFVLFGEREPSGDILKRGEIGEFFLFLKEKNINFAYLLYLLSTLLYKIFL